MNRVRLGKAMRFQVFGRDGFTCLYCGRRPPDVVLQVDHVMPVKHDGDSNMANLVTCCADCNQGKRDEIIVSPFEWEDSELRRLEALQRLAELRAHRQVVAELERELASAVAGLRDRWERLVSNSWAPSTDDIRYLLDDHDPDEVEKAFYLASRRSTGTPDDAWRYACAVLRNWRNQATPAAKDRTGQGRIGQDRTGQEA